MEAPSVDRTEHVWSERSCRERIWVPMRRRCGAQRRMFSGSFMCPGAGKIDLGEDVLIVLDSHEEVLVGLP